MVIYLFICCCGGSIIANMHTKNCIVEESCSVDHRLFPKEKNKVQLDNSTFKENTNFNKINAEKQTCYGKIWYKDRVLKNIEILNLRCPEQN